MSNKYQGCPNIWLSQHPDAPARGRPSSQSSLTLIESLRLEKATEISHPTIPSSIVGPGVPLPSPHQSTDPTTLCFHPSRVCTSKERKKKPPQTNKNGKWRLPPPSKPQSFSPGSATIGHSLKYPIRISGKFGFWGVTGQQDPRFAP